MDFENMMMTPVMYQDIGSSFMMRPMPGFMMMPPMMGYPSYGVAPMRPMLNDDKFERIQQKDKESKNTMIKTGIGLAVMTAAAWILHKRFKIPPKAVTGTATGAAAATTGAKTSVFSKLGTKIKSGFNKIKNLFKKAPAAPAASAPAATVAPTP